VRGGEKTTTGGGTGRTRTRRKELWDRIRKRLDKAWGSIAEKANPKWGGKRSVERKGGKKRADNGTFWSQFGENIGSVLVLHAQMKIPHWDERKIVRNTQAEKKKKESGEKKKSMTPENPKKPRGKWGLLGGRAISPAVEWRGLGCERKTRGEGMR